jgi:SAM-dependent methyltransferase
MRKGESGTAELVAGGDDLSEYRSLMAELGHSPGNLLFALDWMFSGVPLDGRSVLDIGAGAGAASFYAACKGASLVVSLEPEAAGSRSGMQERFELTRRRLHAHQVALRPETLQEFHADGECFDVLVSIASINHLDERACIHLLKDPAARATYAEMFSKLADLTKRGGHLIVADCSRRNVFGDLGVSNPLTPTIEWEKHQRPEVWANLLHDAGFRAPRIRWPAFNTLRWPGRFLLGNRVAAYFLRSTFCLTMERM